ncbi:Hypothetical_protein [Hexamita inflata]|uniref:Hypothetical_protein n=1 Tax=Hexamita inflata TaxID=28002 RepID=A0AA86UUS5_9EUKA|nr:Hypothetical protein HINF_LOCUS60240 [Hexamita inflata]
MQNLVQFKCKVWLNAIYEQGGTCACIYTFTHRLVSLELFLLEALEGFNVDDGDVSGSVVVLFDNFDLDTDLSWWVTDTLLPDGHVDVFTDGNVVDLSGSGGDGDDLLDAGWSSQLEGDTFSLLTQVDGLNELHFSTKVEWVNCTSKLRAVFAAPLQLMRFVFILSYTFQDSLFYMGVSEYQRYRHDYGFFVGLDKIAEDMQMIKKENTKLIINEY